jgi:hypothetical protein
MAIEIPKSHLIFRFFDVILPTKNVGWNNPFWSCEGVSIPFLQPLIAK